MNNITPFPLYDTLRQHGVAAITIDYDGCGDSGCISHVEPLSLTGTPIELPSVQVSHTIHDSVWENGAWRKVTRIVQLSMTEALHQWCYDVLGQLHDGWGNDDGSEGHFTIDVSKGTARLIHNTRFTCTDTTETEL